jgi:glycosyltransferase involved in cell wall biosynthesis
VLMARTTCLPEIAGDHGFYLDSFDPGVMAASYAATLEAFAADPGFGPRSRAHAATYSWGATARGYARVYESVLGQKAPQK